MAEEGLPVVMALEPKQPGKNKSEEYAELYKQLMAFDNASATMSVVEQKPLVEGIELPDFWCRREGDDLYIFFANPAAKGLTYPLRYGQAFEDKGSKREVIINTDAGARPLSLEFKPNESLMVKATAEGEVSIIDLGFTAKRIE